MRWNENIRRLRKKKGLTQKQLGEKIGVTQSAIGQLERGSSNVKIRTLKRIAKALDARFDELFYDEDDVEQIAVEVCKPEYEPVRLSTQFVSNNDGLLSKLRPVLIEDKPDAKQYLGAGLLRDLLLEGMGISDQFDIRKEQWRFRDMVTGLLHEGYSVVRDSLECSTDSLKHCTTLRTSVGIQITLSGIIEYEDGYQYSKCALVVESLCDLDMWEINIPDGCGLSVKEEVGKFTIMSDVIRVPGVLAKGTPYTSRLTGYRLYYN